MREELAVDCVGINEIVDAGSYTEELHVQQDLREDL